MRQAGQMRLGDAWSCACGQGRVRDGAGQPVCIGHLMCVPTLEDGAVVSWVVLFGGETPRVAMASMVGGAPVWLLADSRKVAELTAFEASYWGVGLMTLGEGDELEVVCEPAQVRRAGAREAAVAASHGWRLAGGEQR